MNFNALLVASLGLWMLVLVRGLWRASRTQARRLVRRRRGAARERRRWKKLRRHSAAQSLRLARRLYVAVGSSDSLQRSLAVLIAAEPDGPLRQALQLRLRHLQRRTSSARLPGWQGMPFAPCPPALRVLDELLAGRATPQQALADWRIELLGSRVASCRAYRHAEGLSPATNRSGGAQPAGVADGVEQLQRAVGPARVARRRRDQ